MNAPPADKHPAQSAAPRILIVRNDRIGDLVLTLPAIEALRRHLPNAHITLLASHYAGPLLDAHPAIDELLLDDREQNFWQLAGRLRRGRYDAALAINTNTRNSLAIRLAGIRRRICWGYKPLGWLTATERVMLRRSHPPIHEAEFALAFVRKLGVRESLETRPHLPIDPAVRQRTRHRIRRDLGSAGPLFGIHPGNRQSAYNWPAERYGELADRLTAHGRVMLTGSRSERSLLEEVRSHVAPTRRANIALFTDLAIGELVAAIADQALLVVSSTGPMHLAGLVGTPTVALFSPHPAHVPAKWSPLGDNHTLLVAPLEPGEAPEIPKDRGSELMCRISVETVLRAALETAQRTSSHIPTRSAS